ncbi:hypothetical protein [Chryseobacterium sp. CT-SW4]|uniref:hypothetical protein n=1 Tax=Chryseobacterium sp. SW-1 TaxID=3157343 RepID=UPI003B020347
MKRTTFLVCFLAGFSFTLKGQVGINTENPGSTLTVNGSFSTKYRLLTGSDTATATDEYLDYKGTSDITITLPAAQSGNENFEGRIYEIRNGSPGNTVTVQANGSETIDNHSSNPSSITIPAGFSAIFKSNGATSGSTWILTLLGQSTIPTNEKTLKYSLQTTSPINASTPTNSETCIGVICVRYAGTSPNAYQSGARFQFNLLPRTIIHFQDGYLAEEPEPLQA